MHAIVMMSGWWFCCSIVEDTVGSYADDELPPSKVSFIQFCMLQMRFICSTKPNIRCRDWDTADAAVARFYLLFLCPACENYSDCGELPSVFWA